MKKINEHGRSMVEMLGVLAIIGVLSSGGLAGYSKAMHKHRINQTVEIFRHSLQRLAELEYMPWGDSTYIYSTEDAIKYGLFPKEMCDENYENVEGGEACQLPIGEITPEFVFSSPSYPMAGKYNIFLTKGDKVQTCIDFLSQHWEKQTPAGWWKEDPYDIGGGGIFLFSNTYGETIYTGTGTYDGKVLPAELTLDNIVSACSNACKGDYCGIQLYFRFDI